MTAFEVLIDEVDNKIKQLQEFIGTGRAETFESYKATCGEIKGLLTARGYILDLKQKMENSDDE
jgi:hypothetical protein